MWGIIDVYKLSYFVLFNNLFGIFLVVVVGGLLEIMSDMEDDLTYLGLDKGNANILGHFVKKPGEPGVIRN